jgi:uncharacterized membrane protein (DUF373 family)
MEYLNFILLNIKTSSWFLKILGLGFAILAPIHTTALCMVVMVLVDLFTKIWALAREGKLIRFSKMVRGTGRKVSAYCITTLVLFYFQVAFGFNIIDLTNIFIGLITAGEVSSTLQNMFVITNNKTFLLIKNKIDEWVKNKISK